MTDCKYWNESWGPSFAGRCSAPDDVGTNAVNKFCTSPQTCPYLLEPLYKRKSQMKNQEILNALNEKIKAAEEALLYLNQTKAGLEKVIANSAKTPVEEAYKKVYGKYPVTDIADTCWDGDGWNNFQAGYNAACEEPKENEWKNVALDFGKKLPVILPHSYNELSPNAWYMWVVSTYDKYMEQRDIESGYTPKSQEEVNTLQEKDWKVDVKTNLKPHWEPKPQEPEETEQSLKKAFHREIKQGVVSSSTKQLTLYDICINWWRELHDSCDMNISIEDLVNRIVEEWLPKEMKDDCEGFWTDGYNDYRKSLIRRLN